MFCCLLSSSANIFLTSVASLPWIHVSCVLSLQHLPLTYTMDHFLWVCAEGRIPDLHKYRRRRTVPLCALMLHYSSALQSIIPGKLNIRTLKTNLQIKFKWGDFICIGEGNTKWPNTNARHRMENAGLLRTNKLSCAYLMKEPLKKKHYAQYRHNYTWIKVEWGDFACLEMKAHWDEMLGRHANE